MYFFLSAGIGNTLTGIEHAILKRKQIFDACSLAHKIVTTNFNANYSENLKTHQIGKESFLNLYDDYQNLIFHNFKKNTVDDFLSTIAGEVKAENIVNTQDTRIYIDGSYVCYIHCYDNQQIVYINYFDQNKKKVKRKIYTSNGYLVQSIFLENNQKKWVGYYNDLGELVIEEYFDQDQKNTKIILKHNQKSHFFNSKDEWLTFWLKEVIKRYPHSIFYSDKNKIYNEILVNIKNNDFKLISVFHSVHFRNPKDIIGTLNSNYRVCLNNMEAFDGFLVSTEEQKQDLIARYGDIIKIWVIPPAYAPEPKELYKLSSKNTFNIISVGRYYVEKRLHHIIQAVQILVKKYPFIRLDLYGFGDSRDNFIYEKKIRQMVIDEHLETIVCFKGYVHNISEYIEKAQVSVVTSTIEGFCIGVLDSLSVGTPVVAYDIKYGPKAMIEHGYSGYLVEEENIEQLAQAIEQIYLSPNMSANAQKSAQNFSFAIQKKKWLDHLLELSNV